MYAPKLLPQQGPQGGKTSLTPAPTRQNSSFTEKIRLTPQEALLLVNFIQQDLLSTPNRDICAMLSSAPETVFFDEGLDFNTVMWDSIKLGRAANQDPMVELVMRGLSYYKQFPQISRLLQMVQLELERGETNPLTKLAEKTEVLRLSWSLTQAMNKPEEQLALRSHTKRLEPIGLLIQFIHEHPQFATDPEFLHFCQNPSPDEWTKLLTRKGHEDWKPVVTK